MDVKTEVQREKGEMIRLRREFHRIPEAAFQEQKTSGLIAEMLRGFGLEVRTGIAKTGVVGLLEKAPRGKTIMVRADIDGLPLSEKNELDYVSQHGGMMHACGHDGHIAIALTVAKILARCGPEIKGNVKFVFQPAEEGPGGAKLMIEEGVMENPRVNAALGLHIWNYLPLGKVGIRSGPVMASMDSMKIIIKGKGAHGAIPQDGVDAIMVSSQVINALQTIVSREIAPITPAVVTVGTIQGGYAYNVIADRVEMEGTLRALDLQLRNTFPEKIERIVRGVTSALRADYEFQYHLLYPITVNEEKMAQMVENVAIPLIGSENVLRPEPTMAGEDMAFFLERVPGCFFFLGSANKEKGLDQPHHNSRFNFDEEAMPIGAEILVRSVLRYFNE